MGNLLLNTPKFYEAQLVMFKIICYLITHVIYLAEIINYSFSMYSVKNMLQEYLAKGIVGV